MNGTDRELLTQQMDAGSRIEPTTQQYDTLSRIWLFQTGCERPIGHQFMPSAFIAAVIGSEKNTGSTRSTMSPDTSRKLRLFSNGTNARRAPLSMLTCNGSASVRTALMFP